MSYRQLADKALESARDTHGRITVEELPNQPGDETLVPVIRTSHVVSNSPTRVTGYISSVVPSTMAPMPLVPYATARQPGEIPDGVKLVSKLPIAAKIGLALAVVMRGVYNDVSYFQRIGAYHAISLNFSDLAKTFKYVLMHGRGPLGIVLPSSNKSSDLIAMMGLMFPDGLYRESRSYSISAQELDRARERSSL